MAAAGMGLSVARKGTAKLALRGDKEADEEQGG